MEVGLPAHIRPVVFRIVAEHSDADIFLAFSQMQRCGGRGNRHAQRIGISHRVLNQKLHRVLGHDIAGPVENHRLRGVRPCILSRQKRYPIVFRKRHAGLPESVFQTA